MNIFLPAQRTYEQQAYCDLVDEILLNRTDKEISNGKPEHAVYLMSKLFGLATTKIRLYSDHLKHAVPVIGGIDGDVIDLYGEKEVIKNAIEFLKSPSASLEIVIENDIANLEQHQLVKTIKKAKEQGLIQGKFEIKKINQSGLKWLKDNDFLNHFLVADDHAYRIEIDDNPMNYQARANFNSNSTGYASGLLGLFDSLHWKKSDTQLSV